MPHRELLSPYGIILCTEKLAVEEDAFSLGAGGGDRCWDITYDK